MPHTKMQPENIAIIDNLPGHKVLEIRQCVENAGMHLLYLPRYKPDFNPIEHLFTKLNALLRRMAPRSFDAICDALIIILEKFKITVCSN